MVGGGMLSRRPSAFSGDGRLVLCCSGRLVLIFSAVTGERVGALSGHTEEVTAVVLDPENGEQVGRRRLNRRAAALGSRRRWRSAQ